VNVRAGIQKLSPQASPVNPLYYQVLPVGITTSIHSRPSTVWLRPQNRSTASLRGLQSSRQ